MGRTLQAGEERRECQRTFLMLQSFFALLALQPCEDIPGRVAISCTSVIIAYLSNERLIGVH
jgi:hypothetical protein